MPAWNHWYHCMSNTYGTWLPGDPRGFRTREHREHVEGDYKKPPPRGVYEGLHDSARRGTKRPPVIIPARDRPLVLASFRDALTALDVEVIALSVSGMHLHLLARFPMRRRKPTLNERGSRTSSINDPVRHLIGLAKQRSSKRMIALDRAESGLWARRGKIVPIRDRGHQVRVFEYILEHRREGAAVWSFREDAGESMRGR